MPVNDPGHPVLIVAPVGNDAGALKDLLSRDGIHACVCDDLNHCAPVIKSTNVAVLVLTEEALIRDHLPSLVQALKAQPEWSELPVIILAGEGELRGAALRELTAAAPGAITVLERPLQMATVLATVKVALRSRRRQYQVRDLMEDQQRSTLERQQRAEQLQQALDQRATEVTIAQQGLAAAQRMAAVGTLASGLAHDLGNVLMPLSARVDAVLADARLTGEHRTDLNVVVALIDHLRQMARNLSLFSRDPDQEGIEGFTIVPNWMNRVRNLIDASVTEKHRHGQRITLQWGHPR